MASLAYNPRRSGQVETLAYNYGVIEGRKGFPTWDAVPSRYYLLDRMKNVYSFSGHSHQGRLVAERDFIAGWKDGFAEAKKGKRNPLFLPNPSRHKLTGVEKRVYDLGFTYGEKDAKALDVGLTVRNDTPDIRQMFNHSWERMIPLGEARASQELAMWPAFERGYYDGLARRRNPLFLPKSLFDSYIVKSDGGEITVDKIQTLAGAERKVREVAKKFPCVGFSILSAKHNSVIKHYAAAVGKGTPKVDEDNIREYKKTATREAKESVKFRLFVDGQEYADYESKSEAEKVGRKEAGSGGSWRVKQVSENPKLHTQSRWKRYVIQGGPSSGATRVTDSLAAANRLYSEMTRRFPHEWVNLYDGQTGEFLKEYRGKQNPTPANRKYIRITWSDGNTTETEINGTEEEIRRYYIGQHFNVGRGEHDHVVTGKKVEFLSHRGSSNPAAKIDYVVTYFYANGTRNREYFTRKADADKQLRKYYRNHKGGRGEVTTEPHLTPLQRQFGVRQNPHYTLSYSATLFESPDLKGKTHRVSGSDNWPVEILQSSGPQRARRALIKADVGGTPMYGWVDYDQLIGRRGNPDDSDISDARSLYSDFHGEDSDGETEYVETLELPDNFVELGDLVSLRVITTHGKKPKDVTISAPDPDRHDAHEVVKLASAPDGKQLYFIGGNQSLELNKLDFNNDEIKPAMFIGVLCEVTYRTRKGFDKFKLTDYYHHLGEETGNEPILTYDETNNLMHVVGGAYKVKDVGIVN